MSNPGIAQHQFFGCEAQYCKVGRRIAPAHVTVDNSQGLFPNAPHGFTRLSTPLPYLMPQVYCLRRGQIRPLATRERLWHVQRLPSCLGQLHHACGSGYHYRREAVCKIGVDAVGIIRACCLELKFAIYMALLSTAITTGLYGLHSSPQM